MLYMHTGSIHALILPQVHLQILEGLLGFEFSMIRKNKGAAMRPPQIPWDSAPSAVWTTVRSYCRWVVLIVRT